jgi:hypothetical protein
VLLFEGTRISEMRTFFKNEVFCPLGRVTVSVLLPLLNCDRKLTANLLCLGEIYGDNGKSSGHSRGMPLVTRVLSSSEQVGNQ